ncbi:hypothetical protein DPMN_069207 [Dreissena polymorpha]|uniref:Uncharacterized protein n=1 Tax=Dreissena polymorpha TaxID=45954 RepID=A0A9D4BWZ2_DREPO|nr:hypothetical protein DPMN_069207 [Dreissena polymorpha]
MKTAFLVALLITCVVMVTMPVTEVADRVVTQRETPVRVHATHDRSIAVDIEDHQSTPDHIEIQMFWLG